MISLFEKKWGLFEWLLLVALTAIFYYATFIIPTDIPLHAQFIKDYAYGNKAFPVNFLYYLTVYLLSFFSSKTSALLVISVYVLVGATFAKYVIVKNIFQSEFPESVNVYKISSILSGMLLFCFSLPSIMIIKDFYYLLSFPPNVWHNSTTIFAMPFVLLLFWLSVKQLGVHSTQRLFWIGILIMLNTFIKPSYIFVYLIVYPLLLLNKYRFKRYFWINLIPLFVAMVLIAAEYYLIYLGAEATDKNSVVIAPFAFIKTWAAGENILLVIFCTVISSFLFPIVTLLKNPKLLKSDMIRLALFGVIVAIIIGNTLSESGTRAVDGNFLWQNIMCSFLLFFACLFQMFKLSLEHPKGWRGYPFEAAAFALHVLAGLLYFIKIIITDSYF